MVTRGQEQVEALIYRPTSGHKRHSDQSSRTSADYQVEELVHWDMVPESLLNRPQRLELNDSPNASAIKAERTGASLWCLKPERRWLFPATVGAMEWATIYHERQLAPPSTSSSALFAQNVATRQDALRSLLQAAQTRGMASNHRRRRTDVAIEVIRRL